MCPGTQTGRKLKYNSLCDELSLVAYGKQTVEKERRRIIKKQDEKRHNYI